MNHAEDEESHIVILDGEGYVCDNVDYEADNVRWTPASAVREAAYESWCCSLEYLFIQSEILRGESETRGKDHISRYSQVDFCIRYMQILRESVQSREIDLGRERREHGSYRGCEDDKSFFPCCEGGIVSAFFRGWP